LLWWRVHRDRRSRPWSVQSGWRGGRCAQASTRRLVQQHGCECCCL
jgi:hypothetical protein